MKLWWFIKYYSCKSLTDTTLSLFCLVCWYFHAFAQKFSLLMVVCVTCTIHNMITLNIYAISKKFSLLFAWSVYLCLCVSERCVLHNYDPLFLVSRCVDLCFQNGLLGNFRVQHELKRLLYTEIDMQVNGEHMNVIYSLYLHLAKVLPFVFSN